MSENKCKSDDICQSCGDTEKCSQSEKEAHEATIIAKRMGEIKHKFMVISGKGGVGKTSVSVNLAATLANQGLQWIKSRMDNIKLHSSEDSQHRRRISAGKIYS
jgi:Mrp family chromosome partitioning ATPase